MDVPRIDYFYILAVITSVSFFTMGARMDGRSPIVWGGLSLGAWIGFTRWLMPGLAGGLISQALLFVGLTLYGVARERSTAQRHNSKK